MNWFANNKKYLKSTAVPKIYLKEVMRYLYFTHIQIYQIRFTANIVNNEYTHTYIYKLNYGENKNYWELKGLYIYFGYLIDNISSDTILYYYCVGIILIKLNLSVTVSNRY